MEQQSILWHISKHAWHGHFLKLPKWKIKHCVMLLQIAKREEEEDEDERDTTKTTPQKSGIRLKVPGSRA